MDMTFPLVKTGVIGEAMNLWLAIPIGFIFGFALFHAGFTDSRRIAWAFYFKSVRVPVVMFTAIVTGMLGLWGLSLVGVLDISEVYMLPTFLTPMAIGGLLFGIGMVVGGYCPGTAAAALATGKVDGMVFIVGFLIGSLVFGDFFPVWGDFYNSDYMGAFRLDQWLDIGLGVTVLGVVVVAVAGIATLSFAQRKFWSGHDDDDAQPNAVVKLQFRLVAVAVLIAAVYAFFPTDAFIDDTTESPYYIVPRANAEAAP